MAVLSMLPMTVLLSIPMLPLLLTMLLLLLPQFTTVKQDALVIFLLVIYLFIKLVANEEYKLHQLK